MLMVFVSGSKGIYSTDINSWRRNQNLKASVNAGEFHGRMECAFTCLSEALPFRPWNRTAYISSWEKRGEFSFSPRSLFCTIVNVVYIIRAFDPWNEAIGEGH